MKDLTVLAIPVYFGSMGAEYLWLRRESDVAVASAGLYERRDTAASLAMGVGSLVTPLVLPKVLKNVVPGTGRHGRFLLATAAGAAAVTTLADLLVRRSGGAGDEMGAGSATTTAPGARPIGRAPEAGRHGSSPEPRSSRSPSSRHLRAGRRLRAAAERVSAAGGVTAVVAGGLAVTTSWASRTGLDRLARRRRRTLGTGPLAVGAAVAAWDFLYYWNHRAMHESRFMWAIHVVHHSSERYNLSTALRQPVAEAFGTFLPYSGLTLLGFEPALVNTARGINLLYQFFIHTETIRRLGPLEGVLNTPSHHRVHHGSNGPYLDRNHGSILILWDRLFGTFQAEEERPVYGLTKNIDTFNPWRIATHEYAAMFGDVARSRTWRDRLGFVVLGPGWAGRRRAEMLEAGAGAPSELPVPPLAQPAA